MRKGSPNPADRRGDRIMESVTRGVDQGDLSTIYGRVGLSMLLFAGLMLVACSLFKAQDGSDTDTENTVPEVTVAAVEPEPTSSVSAKKTVDSNLGPGGVTLPAPNSTVVEELESVEKYLGAKSLEERIVNYPTVVRATLILS